MAGLTTTVSAIFSSDNNFQGASTLMSRLFGGLFLEIPQLLTDIDVARADGDDFGTFMYIARGFQLVFNYSI